MTTEIAIMNKSAIALAADSAVTFSKRNGQLKIYNTVNKLFALSKYEPVGIMIFDSAELMGLPWETIIKIYRSGLDSKKFLTLEHYAKDFLAFLSDNTQLFPKDVQSEYFRELAGNYFARIAKATLDECDRYVAAHGPINDDKIAELLEAQIRSHCEALGGEKDAECLPQDFFSSLAKEYPADILESKIRESFGKAQLSEQSKVLLRAAAIQVFSKDFFLDIGNSGIVIAGFGDTEPFPSFRSYIVQGVLGNKLKFKPFRSASINFTMGASITPFAQDEMVHTFMQGVDPGYEHYAVNSVNDIVKKYYFDPIENAVQMNDQEKKELLKNLRGVQAAAIKELRDKLSQHKRTNYIDPILDAVAALPKDELAAMAESLVSLTILKRRVSMTAETVGGAIDVALISKGDGLIWIKRKHYFDKNLNAQFLANYYRKDDVGML